MKNLSLKLDDEIFDETEIIAGRLKLNRNRYINNAVSLYNQLQKRKLLSKKLALESRSVQKESMRILRNSKNWMMNIQQYELWLADLNPRFGTETGKIRPVVIVQTDLLNKVHPSTIICPITTNIKLKAEILRVHLKKGACNVVADCDIMVDQIRAIDNKRFLKKTGKLSPKKIIQLQENLKIVFDL